MITTINHAPMNMTATTSSCLIRYIEIWKPDPDMPGRVILESCNVVESDALRPVTSSTSALAAGEGIVGSAVQQRGPVIYQDMPSVDLERMRNESGVDINAVLAFPVFDDHDLVNVIAFGFVQGYGAVELWSRDDRDELSISGSFYRGLESFEYISQHVRFPKGAGLPGYCWKFNQATMLNDPASNPNFIRSFDRDPATLSAVIGIPVSREYGFPSAIMLLLSSAEIPLARYIGIAKVESGKPTDEIPAPPCTVVAIEGSTLEGEEVSWQSEITDQVAASRSVVLFSQDNSNLDAAGIAIPCFSKGAIDRLIFFKF